MNEDRIERAARKAIGKTIAKPGRTAADPAGGERLDARSVVEQVRGTVQDGYGRAREAVRDMLDGAPTVARDAVETGRDYYRRGSAAVVRSAGDNTALTILAAGVAIAAVSWLVLGRRGGTSRP